MTEVAATIVESRGTCSREVAQKYGDTFDQTAVLAPTGGGWPDACARVTYNFGGKTYTVPMAATQPVGWNVRAVVFEHRPDVPLPMWTKNAEGLFETIPVMAPEEKDGGRPPPTMTTPTGGTGGTGRPVAVRIAVLLLLFVIVLGLLLLLGLLVFMRKRRRLKIF